MVRGASAHPEHHSGSMYIPEGGSRKHTPLLPSRLLAAGREYKNLHNPVPAGYVTKLNEACFSNALIEKQVSSYAQPLIHKGFRFCPYVSCLGKTMKHKSNIFIQE